jgi:hypothetical protein
MPCSGTLNIDTCSSGTDFDTVLSIFDSCNGTELQCNDDSADAGCQINGLNRRSHISRSAFSGEVYYIRVSGFQGAVGNFVLTVDAHCLS